MASSQTLEASLLTSLLSGLEAHAETITDDGTRQYVTFSDLKVWTRDNPPKLVPLQPNTVQGLFLTDITRYYGCDPVTPWRLTHARANILKARQQGFSTILLALWYSMLYNLEYSQSVVITNRAESTAMLWARVQLWEQQLRKEQKRPLPKLRYSSRRELTRADTGSSLFIGTAGEDDLTRSGTITNLHLTETAFWAGGAGAASVAALGTLPDHANLIEESTAQGMGDHYERYEAQRTGESSLYRVYFFPFSDTPEYSAPVPPTFARRGEEVTLAGSRSIGGIVTRTPLTDGQILWRRNRKEEFLMRGEPDRFQQEFPLSDTEAFVSSGNNYFNLEYLQGLYREQSEPDSRPLYDGPASVHYANAPGVLQVWEEMDEDLRYVIGADDAAGIEKKGKDHDYSTADVFCVETRRQVASYYGRIDPTEFGELLDLLGKDFNRARIIVENDPRGYGLRTIERLQELHYPYIYEHKTVEVEKKTGRKIEETTAGYPARQNTKRERNDLLAAAINQAAAGYGDLLIRSLRAIKELMTYVKVEGNKAEGDGRAHDDHVTSIGLAYYLCDKLPRYMPKLDPAPPTGGYGRSTQR